MIKRSLPKEQMRTAELICEQLEIGLENKGGVFTLYKSVGNAKKRTGKKKGYENVKFLLGDKIKESTINLIKNPAIWYAWGELQKVYEKSGYDPALRPSLHRIDKNGHYQEDNLAAVPVGEHNLEHAKATMLLAFDTKAGLRLGGFESKSDARKQLGIADGTLTKMIDGDFDYTNKQGDSMTFLQLVPVDEPLPKFKINDEDFLKSLEEYLQSLKNFQKFDYCEKRAKAIGDLSKRLDYYTQREKQS